jgi:hypothetical protein
MGLLITLEHKVDITGQGDNFKSKVDITRQHGKASWRYKQVSIKGKTFILR